MAPAARSDGKLNLNLSEVSQSIDHNGVPKGLNGGMSSTNNTRLGAGSPLHDSGSRLFMKRTRELQGQTISPSIWGPPSGSSTPLQLIPESPSQDSFPDLVPLSELIVDSSKKRLRAGTLPSRISPVGTLNGVNVNPSASKTSRPTPSTSPFRVPTTTSSDTPAQTEAAANHASLLSRLRAGSMPQRSSYLGAPSPFGSSVFASNWLPRDRAATLTSIKSSEDPASPTLSGFMKESMTDNGVRTLDYLGLAETPQQSKVAPFISMGGSIPQGSSTTSLADMMANLDARGANRLRSFSVNAPRGYAEDKDDSLGNVSFPYSSGALTPSAAAALEAEYEAVQEKVRLHNRAVQDFAKNASAARPRARTAGIIETPQRPSYRNLAKALSPIENGVAMNENLMDSNLADSFQSLSMHPEYTVGVEDESQASRSLWIGSIPASTTTSSLDAIFSPFGPLESTRVLTHKNCGFVNFEALEDAVRARTLLNSKEIFPGSGPIRIGYAKVPSAINSITPMHSTRPTSPNKDTSVDPSTHLRTDASRSGGQVEGISNGHSPSSEFGLSQNRRLAELQPEILGIVVDFGAQQSDIASISASIDRAIDFQQLEKEIPPISEPSHTRMYDAPRLRDIRKRIDNGACHLQEIEQIAKDMLPEIAELASDYLGNTVVQKLFEFCSEQTKEQMLSQIAPHLGEIGIHKNGTWAAQKIIEVCKTEPQMRMISESLRPYTIPLFLDQYGNYVLQCCLRFGPPFNDFIFETMLSHMMEIAQGRFGARAMRACLESHHSSKHQQWMIAAAIALKGVELATNTNGALLLTWFLDTCTFPSRRSVLAPRLNPHLVQLCTHKVAYLTVLKVINQRNEPEARDMTLEALFFSPGDSVLEQILSDQTSGATLIFKILTTPFFDDQVRVDVVRNISRVLTSIKAQPNQGYKRLMDEVGLSSRPPYVATHNPQPHAHPYTNSQARPMSQPNTANFGLPPPPPQRQYSGNFPTTSGYNPMQNGQSPIRTGSADSYGYPSYPLNGYNLQSAFQPLLQMTPQQLQYQNFMNSSQRSHHNNYIPSAGVSSFSGYATPPPSVDALRGMQGHGSPMYTAAQMSPIMGSSGYTADPYSQPFQGNMYGYPQMQTVQGPGRGRRR